MSKAFQHDLHNENEPRSVAARRRHLLKKSSQWTRIGQTQSLQDMACGEDTQTRVLSDAAMRDATVLFYNPPLLAMQKAQGLIPKKVKTLEGLYKALYQKAVNTQAKNLNEAKMAFARQ